MSEIADYAAKILGKTTLAERRRELSRVPLHIRADVEAAVRSLWKLSPRKPQRTERHR